MPEDKRGLIDEEAPVGVSSSETHAGAPSRDEEDVTVFSRDEIRNSTCINHAVDPSQVKISDSTNNNVKSDSAPAVLQTSNIEEGASDKCEVVKQGGVVFLSTGTGRVIVTPDTAPKSPPKPVSDRRLTLAGAFSVLALITFLPFGIASVIYWRKARVEFSKGEEHCDMNRVRKFTKRSERFTILSVFVGILMVVFILGVIYEMSLPDDEGLFYHHQSHLGVFG